MSIKNEIKSGVLYTFIFRYINLAVQMLIGAILARLLTPNEYGVAAIVTVLVLFFQLLSNFGLGTAIIQKQGLTQENIFSLFLFTLIVGLIISLLFSLLGPLIATFYNEPAYKKIANILSFSLFFHTANIVPYALLMKEKKFKAVGIIYVSVEIISGIITIILAYNGFSYYSLVYRSVIIAFLLFIIDVKIVKIKFFKSINFSIIQNLFSYSFFQLLYNIVDYISKTMATLLIGKYLGTTALGYYDRAYRLVLMPVNNLTNIITPVLHPVLANHQSETELIFNVLRKTTKFLSIIGIPLSFFLYFSAAEIIGILYGNQWIASIPAFEYLSLSVWIQMVLASTVSIFQALGRTTYLFIYGLFSSTILITAVIFGVFIGKSFISVTILLVVAYIIIVVFAYYILIIKLFKRNLFEFITVFLPGIYAGIAVLLVNMVFKSIVEINNLIFSLLIKITLSGAVFFLILILLNEFKGFISLLNPKKNE